MRCPRVAARHCHSRAAWASACRHYDRRARCIAGSATPAGGNPPREPVCHEAWPRLSLGMNSPIGKSRGGTPRGERAALCARRTRKVRSLATRLSAFRFLAFLPFLHSWLEAQIVRIPVSTAGVLWRRSVRRAEKFSSRDDDSGANRIARTRSLFHLSPVRGEVERAKRGRVRGRCRDSELCRNSDSGGDAPSPHPLPARGERECDASGEREMSLLAPAPLRHWRIEMPQSRLVNRVLTSALLWYFADDAAGRIRCS